MRSLNWVKKFSGVYGVKVVLPLILVIVFGLVFIGASSHHKTVNSSLSLTSTKKICKLKSSIVSSSSGSPKLSSGVKTEDLDPNDSPTSLQTFSPQANSSSLQGSADASNGSTTTTPSTTNQPSLSEIENFINGTTNSTINTNTVKSVIDGKLKL